MKSDPNYLFKVKSIVSEKVEGQNIQENYTKQISVKIIPKTNYKYQKYQFCILHDPLTHQCEKV